MFSLEPFMIRPFETRRPRCHRTSGVSCVDLCMCRDFRDRRSVTARGFSLVELIVVMVILGMLASLVAVQTRGFLIRSKQNAAKAEIANLSTAVETFYADRGRYPTTDEGLEVLTQPTETWPEAFIKRLPKDPWKNDYEYFSPGSTGPYEIVSLGGDGREGGEGEARDFSSDDLSDDPA